jgi:hypothetical protein
MENEENSLTTMTTRLEETVAVRRRELEWDGFDNFEFPAVEDMAAYIYLVKYVFIELFLLVGLFSLLYTPLMTHLLVKNYKSNGKQIHGQVLSCDPLEDNTNAGTSASFVRSSTRQPQMEVAVLYEAEQQKYHDNATMLFRHPNEMVLKRYLRRFHLPAVNHIEQQLPKRGDVVPMLLLANLPRSGFLCREVERMLMPRPVGEFSWARHWLLCVPGFVLLSTMVFSAVTEVKNTAENPRWHYGALIISWSLILSIVWTKSERKFQQQIKARRFCSAVAVSSVSSSARMTESSLVSGNNSNPQGVGSCSNAQTKKEPLLPAVT